MFEKGVEIRWPEKMAHLLDADSVAVILSFLEGAFLLLLLLLLLFFFFFFWFWLSLLSFF